MAASHAPSKSYPGHFKAARVRRERPETYNLADKAQEAPAPPPPTGNLYRPRAKHVVERQAAATVAASLGPSKSYPGHFKAARATSRLDRPETYNLANKAQEAPAPPPPTGNLSRPQDICRPGPRTAAWTLDLGGRTIPSATEVGTSRPLRPRRLSRTPIGPRSTAFWIPYLPVQSLIRFSLSGFRFSFIINHSIRSGLLPNPKAS